MAVYGFKGEGVGCAWADETKRWDLAEGVRGEYEGEEEDGNKPVP